MRHLLISQIMKIYTTKRIQNGEKMREKAEYADAEQRLFRQRELTYVYRAYEEALIAESRYDYDDMILMVRNQLQNDPHHSHSSVNNISLSWSMNFRIPMVSRQSIVHLIMHDQEQPNILVVGDDEHLSIDFSEQSWKILNFCDTYRDRWLTIIPLVENYRSTQTILDASRELIRNNSESLEKLWISINISKNARISEKKISIFTPSDPQIEIAWLVSEMQKLHDEGMSWSDMAIIYRKNANPIHLIEYLRRKKSHFTNKRRKISFITQKLKNS